jgi:hypothetical protein
MLGEDILTKNFCGKTDIADKMKVVYFASYLKETHGKKIDDNNKNQFENSLYNNPY